jgi:dephospho-CoA kinase
MKKIGVTGGIGSGKSYVCKIIESMGYPVFYTDDESKKILHKNIEVKNFVIENYGDESFIDGKPNSKHLANILFNNDIEMKRLHEMVSPIFKNKLKNWFNLHKNKDFCFVESAIMFEYRLHKEFDFIICISADLETRINRVLNRDSHRTREDIITIISKQLNDDKRKKLSDYVIFNNIKDGNLKSIEEFKQEINTIIKKIK